MSVQSDVVEEDCFLCFHSQSVQCELIEPRIRFPTPSHQLHERIVEEMKQQLASFPRRRIRKTYRTDS